MLWIGLGRETGCRNADLAPSKHHHLTVDVFCMSCIPPYCSNTHHTLRVELVSVPASSAWQVHFYHTHQICSSSRRQTTMNQGHAIVLALLFGFPVFPPSPFLPPPRPRAAH
eukprot:5410572-Pyramimonas_sp.AAC.1